MRENHNAFHRIWLRPRVLVNVKEIDVSTTMLGAPVSMPLYISATALGKLGHPDGELVLTRASGEKKIIQMIPTLGSCSFDEIVDAALPAQTQWLQLYVNSDRPISEALVRHAEKRGIKGLFVTVDAAQMGNVMKRRGFKCSTINHHLFFFRSPGKGYACKVFYGRTHQCGRTAGRESG